MPDFTYTGALFLANAQLTGHMDKPTLVPGTLSWDGWADQTSAGTMTDIGLPGLERNIDGIGGFDFTGYYIEVGGQNFGVFSAGQTFIVPYNGTYPLYNTAFFPNAPGSTALFAEILATPANCFVTGTSIATSSGPRPVETLVEGDLICTADGDMVPVKWLWHQSITNGTWLPDAVAPVRVRKDSLGPGVPSGDLLVSADHGLFVDGLMINAGVLVNGHSITYEPLGDLPARFTYWHIETQAHDVILAEGCPTESFIDYAGRQAFDNYDAYLARYGSESLIFEHSAPRVSSARLVPTSLRARLRHRAGKWPAPHHRISA